MARSLVTPAMLPSKPPTDDHTILEQRILHIVGQLVAELRPGSAAAGISASDSLDRELGLGSLERVELLARIERELGIRLTDHAMASADTPADLVRAVISGKPAAVDALPSRLPALDAASAAPDSATTLIEVLHWHARHAPHRPHIFLRHEDGHENTITYAQLWRQSITIAQALHVRGIRQRDTVTLMLRTEPAFFPCFFGTLLAGAIPVPIYPPFRADQIEDYAQRQAGILTNAGTRLMITFAAVERLASLLKSQIPTLSAVTTPDELVRAVPLDTTTDTPLPPAPIQGLSDQDPALIQYTSGSTGEPKGVLLTHGNLLANIRAIRDGLDIQPDDVAVSWLPLYHDMGLIGAWLSSMYTGIPVVILSPLTFLSRPARWLWAIHAHQATVSVAPNFAFDLCVNKIRNDEIDGLDLGTLKVLLNGSEAVLAPTLTRFLDRFASHGLRRDVMRPVYGLAESSVGLAITPRRESVLIDRIAPDFRTNGRAIPSETNDALSFVSCGSALPHHEIRVVDANDIPLDNRHEGRVQFRGPSMMSGYYRNASATRAITTHDGWLDSGDLGYLADGELFLTGRRKDVIIKGGRNLYPHEVEAIVADIKGVRKGCVAAFGVADPSLGTEQFILVAETRATDPAVRTRLEQDIREQVTDALGVPPDSIVLGQPGVVRKTSSGKVRRGSTRDAFVTGTLDRGVHSLAHQWASLAWHAIRGRLRGLADLVLGTCYTAYILSLMAVTVPLLWGLVLLGRQPNTVRRLLQRAAKCMIGFSGCRVSTTGLEHLRELGPAIFVANHASFVDVVVVLATLSTNLRFAAKGQLTTYPVLGTIIPRAGYIPIDKSNQADRMEGAKDVVAALANGESMFVFPEGTFVRAPGLLPFRLGAFRAAAETGYPVVPLALAGTRQILPADTLLMRHGHITVTIGHPLQPRGHTWKDIVRLKEDARQFIATHAGEHAG